MRILLFIFVFASLAGQSDYKYNELQDLFIEWRKFENPPLLNGAPDYTKKQFKKTNCLSNYLLFTIF